MAVDERARHALHRRLEELLGPDVTGTLMELLPPVGWADVATAHDVARGQAALADRLDAQIAGVRIDMADLRTEMIELRSHVDTGLAALRSDMDGGLADLRSHVDTGLAELRSHVDTGLAELRSHVDTGLVDVRSHVDTGLVDVRSHADAGLAGLRVEMANGFGEVHRELAAVQRHLFFGMLGAMFTLTGVIWAIVTFAG